MKYQLHPNLVAFMKAVHASMQETTDKKRQPLLSFDQKYALQELEIAREKMGLVIGTAEEICSTVMAANFFRRWHYSIHEFLVQPTNLKKRMPRLVISTPDHLQKALGQYNVPERIVKEARAAHDFVETVGRNRPGALRALLGLQWATFAVLVSDQYIKTQSHNGEAGLLKPEDIRCLRGGIKTLW